MADYDPQAVLRFVRRDYDPRFNEPDEAPRFPVNNTGPDAVGQLREQAAGIKPTAAQSAVGGALQGATGGFSDEAGAAVESALTGQPYAQLRDANRAELEREKEAHKGLYRVGQFAGGLATPSGLAAGAASGLGYSDAPLLSKRAAFDTALGLGSAYLGNKVGQGVTKFIGKAAERNEQRALGELTDNVRSKVANRVTNEVDRVREVIKEPAMRAAMGDPAKVLEASRAGIQEAGDAAEKILIGADKNAAAVAHQVGSGGMLPHEVVGPLEVLKNDMIKSSQKPAAISAIQGVIDQFRSGIGKAPGQPVAATDVRRFLTQQVQRYAFKGDPMNPDTPATQEALQRASGALKDALLGHVQKNASPTAVSALQKLWDRSTAYHAIEAAAEQQVNNATKAPGALQTLASWVKNPGTIGATVGGAVAGAPGAVAGTILGKAAPHAAAAADRALENPAVAAATGAAARRVAQALPGPLVDAFVRKDDNAAKEELARHFFVDPAVTR